MPACLFCIDIESVAYAGFIDEELRSCGVCFQFMTKLCHVDAQVMCLTRRQGPILLSKADCV